MTDKALSDFTPLANIAALRALGNDYRPIGWVDVVGYRVADVSSAPDAGGGRFYYDSDDATTADDNGVTIVDQAGRRWKRVIQNSTVSPEFFGAYGDNTNDDTAAVQAAVDWAIDQYNAGNQFPIVRLLGAYKISNSIILVNIYDGDYHYFTMEFGGGGQGYVSGHIVGLFPTFVNRPALLYQGARRLVLRRFSIQGLASSVDPSVDDLMNDTVTPWWNTNSARDSRYSPYCGIAGDPFSYAVPPDGGYPSMSAYYGISNFPTTDVMIDEVSCFNFIVGMAIGLSYWDANSDAIVINHPTLYGNKVHVAVGNRQARAVSLYEGNFANCRILADASNYGKGTADVPKIVGGQSVMTKWLMVGGGDTACFNRLYCESIFSVGYWSGIQGAVFRDCVFKFMTSAYGTSVPDYHFRTAASALFSHCQMTFDDNETRSLSIMNAGFISFEYCTFADTPILTDPTKVGFRDCVSYLLNRNYSVSAYFDARLSAVAGTQDSHLTPGGVVNDYDTYSQLYQYRFDGGWEYKQLETVTITVAGDGTGSFTSAHPEYYYEADTLVSFSGAWVESTDDPKDIGGADPTGLSIGRVLAISGSDISLDMVPVSMPSGSYQIWLSHYPTLRNRGTGTTTSGSSTVTGVPANTWRAGHHINGTGIPDNTRVIGSSGTTITLSKNATANGTVEIYDGYITLVSGLTTTAVGAPASGFFRRGEIIRLIDPPAVDGNGNLQVGYVCTVSGNPATFADYFVKTTS